MHVVCIFEAYDSVVDAKIIDGDSQGRIVFRYTTSELEIKSSKHGTRHIIVSGRA